MYFSRNCSRCKKFYKIGPWTLETIYLTALKRRMHFFQISSQDTVKRAQNFFLTGSCLGSFLSFLHLSASLASWEIC